MSRHTHTDSLNILNPKTQLKKPTPYHLKKKTQKPLNTDKLNILHLNARGLRTDTKYTLFANFIGNLKTKPDIIFLNEHWLDKHQVQTFFVKG